MLRSGNKIFMGPKIKAGGKLKPDQQSAISGDLIRPPDTESGFAARI